MVQVDGAFPRVSKVHDGLIELTFPDFSFRMKVEGDRVAHHLCVKNYEPETLKLWTEMCQDAVRRDQMVVDVGAYTGLFSLIAAGCGARVIAFEPMPDQHRRLSENIIINGWCERIWPAEVALSDVASFSGAQIRHNPNSTLSCGASLSPDKDQGPTPQFHDVMLLPLDHFNLPSCGALKVDVERHEPFVLRGARGLIERCCPPMIVEMLDGVSSDVILEELPDGYVVAKTLDVRNALVCPQ